MAEAKNYKILVVDDEKDILDLLKYNLKVSGYTVKTSNNGEDALKVAKSFKPDIILLDVMMPKQDGIETCRLLREDKSFKDTIVVFLTARSEEYSEIVAFDVGADDYIIKPIKPRALLSRLQAILRRKTSPKDTVEEENIIEIGDLYINKNSYVVKVAGRDVTLAKKEFELLYFLAKSPNKVFTREALLQNIWGTDVYVLARTVDVHVRKVREKIGMGYIKTKKGVGYKFLAN